MAMMSSQQDTTTEKLEVKTLAPKRRMLYFPHVSRRNRWKQ